MIKRTTDVPDQSGERQRLVDDMIADDGAEWAEKYAPGTFGCHELVDRTAVAAELVERQILWHPACIQNPQWYALAEQAVAALNALYQQVGAKHGAADLKPEI